MNVRIYLIIVAIVSIVDTTDLVCQLKHFRKERQQECNFNFIKNGWARLATRCG